jgi:hypothetical protein
MEEWRTKVHGGNIRKILTFDVQGTSGASAPRISNTYIHFWRSYAGKVYL